MLWGNCVCLQQCRWRCILTVPSSWTSHWSSVMAASPWWQRVLTLWCLCLRLAQERQAAEEQRLQQPADDDQRQKMLDSLSKAGVDNFTMKAAVPGTEIPGHKVQSSVCVCMSVWQNQKSFIRLSSLIKMSSELPENVFIILWSSQGWKYNSCSGKWIYFHGHIVVLWFQDWVVSKFGRVLPVLQLRCQKGKRARTVKYDPSKYSHNIRRLDLPTADQPTPVTQLTWEVQGGDDDISKKRRGEFPPYEPSRPKKSKTDVVNSSDAVGRTR